MTISKWCANQVWDISSSPLDAGALPLEVCQLAHAIEATEKRYKRGTFRRDPEQEDDEWRVAGLVRRGASSRLITRRILVSK